MGRATEVQFECPECPEAGGVPAWSDVPKSLVVRGEPAQSALLPTALNKQTNRSSAKVPPSRTFCDANADLREREVKLLPFCADNPSSRA